eukprot:3787209-Pleurochrysis_carterae.AAC.2
MHGRERLGSCKLIAFGTIRLPCVRTAGCMQFSYLPRSGCLGRASSAICICTACGLEWTDALRARFRSARGAAVASLSMTGRPRSCAQR